MNAHGLPNGKPKEFYSALSNGDLKGYPTRGRESRDTIYFHDMFLRLVRAIDFLTAQPSFGNRGRVVAANRLHSPIQRLLRSLDQQHLETRV